MNPASITPELVQAARRQLARDSLADFAQLVDIPTVPLTDEADEDRFSVMKLGKMAKHHLLICDCLQKVENGTIPNLMLLFPPGSAKSTYTDVVFIPWFMSLKARRHVILASYATGIAEKQGRRARQLINSRSFLNITGQSLRQDQKAAAQWTLENGSEFMAGGILSGLTGNRAALGILDDPISGREDAESETIRDKTWNAYVDDFCSRLIPGAPQVMVLCMAGGTPVLMADGSEKPLQDIRVGDLIATYENGVLVASRVANWRNNGPDSVYEITTTSGITVKANERHPFLVKRNGELRWVRLRNLRPGDAMVRASSARMRDVKLEHTSAPSVTATMTPESECIQRATTGNGRASSAQPKGAKRQPVAKVCVASTTVDSDGRMGTDRRQQGGTLGRTSSFVTGTALVFKNTKRFLLSKAGSVQSAFGMGTRALQSIGLTASASTTTTRLDKSEACCATTAIWSSGEEGGRTFSSAPLSTWSVTEDEVLSIHPCGREDVFDIQVDRTENFIAGGLVSHNTRWHEEDPAGRILPEGWDGESGWFNGRDGRKWYVLCVPAIADRADDPLGRQLGETLWPEWFSMDHWKPFQTNARTWSSLYQQKPAPQEGTFFRKEWFKSYRRGSEPARLNYYMTSDHAPGGESDSDFTCVRVWGMDATGDLYLMDGFRTQETLDLSIAKALALAKKWRPFCWFPERDNNWLSVAGFVKAEMLAKNTFCRIEPISPHGASKESKAQAFQGIAAAGRVWLPGGPDGDDILSQYLKFPAGKNDDEVDTASLIGRAIAEAHPAILPVQEKSDPRDDWDRAFDRMGGENDGENWKTA